MSLFQLGARIAMDIFSVSSREEWHNAVYAILILRHRIILSVFAEIFARNFFWKLFVGRFVEPGPNVFVS